MTSAFENRAGPGKPLRAEPPDAKEFAGLQRSGLARLNDAQNEPLSEEGRSIWLTSDRRGVAWSSMKSPRCESSSSPRRLHEDRRHAMVHSPFANGE